MPAPREDTHPLGVVYTPPDVARAMTHLALAPLVENKSSSDILSLRVCDPAAGTGAFLVEVVAYLAEHLVTAWHRERRDPSVSDSLDAPTWAQEAHSLIARTCIVGVDVDDRALRDAARHLSLDPSCFDAPRVAEVHRGTAALRVANALTLDWRSECADIFARGGFDVVLANPPYIRQESLASKSALESFAVYDGVADLYVYFVELAHRLLRPGGRYCVIVPNKWMTVDYGRPLRMFLAQQQTVDGIADLSTHALFANADAFPCIVWGTAGASSERPLVGVRATEAETVADILERADVRRPLADSHGERELELERRGLLVPRDRCLLVPRDRWTTDPWHIDTSWDRFLLERLALSYPTLGDVIGSRWSRGVVTGLNEAFVIDRPTRDALVSTDLACSSWIRPFLRGRDIRPYAPSVIERWLLLVDRGTPLDLVPAPIRDHLARFRERLEPKPADHAGAWPGRKPGSYAWHELQDPVVPLAKSRAPRLFYQDIQTAPACCFDPDGELVPDTTVWIVPSSDRYLLAILNSRLYHWYARRRFPPALNGAVRPKLAYMQRFPIPAPSSDLRREIEALVDRRLALPSTLRSSIRGSSTMLRSSTRGSTTDSATDLVTSTVATTSATTTTSGRELDIVEQQIERLVEIAYELSSVERALIAT